MLQEDTAILSLCQGLAPGGPPGGAPAAVALSPGSSSLRSTWTQRKQLQLAPPDQLQLQEELRSIILTIRQSVEPCNPTFFKTLCRCGTKVWKRGCGSYDCPECSTYVKKRRARRAKERLDVDRRGKAILMTVLTVPPELRSRYADRRTWRKDLRSMWKVLQVELSGEFGIESSHPVGSSDEEDFDPDLFHPHANFLWRQKPGGSPFVDVGLLIASWTAITQRLPLQLALWTWKEIREEERDLAAALQKWMSVLGVRRVSVGWHHYFKDPGELSRRIEYCMRPFPGYSSWTGSVRWYGRYPRREKLPLKFWSCPDCGELYLILDFPEFLSTRDEYEEYLARSKCSEDPDLDLDGIQTGGGNCYN